MSVSHTPQRVLMVSKLNPPASRAAQVQRAGLCHKILSASAAKLVVVRASAGFGKTTAMTQSMSRMNASGIATAWLTIMMLTMTFHDFCFVSMLRFHG